MRSGALTANFSKPSSKIRRFADGGGVGNLGSPDDPADFITNVAAASAPGAVNQASAQTPQLFGGSDDPGVNGPLTQNSRYQQLRSQLDSANADRLARISNAKNILQAAQGNQTSNLPMMAAAAGFLRPTPGGFAGSMSNALSAAIPAIEQQRKDQQNSATAQAQLDMQYGDVADQAAQQALQEYGVNFFKDQTQATSAATQAEAVRHNKAAEATSATSTKSQANYYDALAAQAGATEYKYQSGLGPDTSGKQVQGAYKISDDPKEAPQFIPGMVLGDKAAAMALGGNSIGDDAYAAKVANFAADPPSPRARTTPDGRAFMNQVIKLNPDWNEETYQGSKRAYNDFMVGTPAKSTTAFDTAISHISLLKQYGDALQNSPNSQTANALSNMVSREFGSTAPTNYDSIAPVIAAEVVKANTGSEGALGDRETIVNNFKNKSTDDQIHGIADSYLDLMGSKMAVLAREYQGKTKRTDFAQTQGLTPEGIDILNRHLPSSFGGTQGAPPQAAPGPTDSPANATPPAITHGAQAPAGAIQLLRQNPALAPQFDAKYGAGAAKSILGSQ